MMKQARIAPVIAISFLVASPSPGLYTYISPVLKQAGLIADITTCG
jgi:hypothetical protein